MKKSEFIKAWEEKAPDDEKCCVIVLRDGASMRGNSYKMSVPDVYGKTHVTLYVRGIWIGDCNIGSIKMVY